MCDIIEQNKDRTEKTDMFWNRKKKEEPQKEDELDEIEELDEVLDEEVIDEEESEAEGSDEEGFDEEGFDEEDMIEEEEREGEEEIPDVTIKIKSFDELLDFVTERKASVLQFMNKTTLEAFELRESHIRIAGVWGSVSMSRECSPSEYARIMLACELTEDPDRFYVLPALTEKEAKQAMLDFCKERYNENGKKYLSSPKKFMALVESNGDEEEWKAHIKAANYDKLKDFCKENGIEL